MPNLLNASPEEEKAWEKIGNDLPDILYDDYSTENVINGLRMAGWNGKKNMRAVGVLALLLNDSHDSDTLELLSSQEPQDKKKVVESIISNLEDLNIDEFINNRPEAMAYVYNAWNETHPDEPAKTFPGMEEQLTKELREEYVSIFTDDNTVINREELAAGLIAAGFDDPDDVPLVTAIYKLASTAGSVDILYDISGKKYTSRDELLGDLHKEFARERERAIVEREAPGELAMVEEAWSKTFGLPALEKETFIANARANGWFSTADRNFLSQLYDDALNNEDGSLSRYVNEINKKDLWNASERKAYITVLQENIVNAEGKSAPLKRTAQRVTPGFSQEKMDDEKFKWEQRKVSEVFVERARAQGWKEEDVPILEAINERIEKERSYSTTETSRAMSEYRRKLMETPLDPKHYYTSRNELLRGAEQFKNHLWTTQDVPGIKGFNSKVSLKTVVEKSLPMVLGESHDERKSLWLKQMEDAGWTLPGDEEFLSQVYEGRLNADKSVDREYDRLLNDMADPKKAPSRATALNRLSRRLLEKNDNSPKQEQIYDLIIEERRIWDRLTAEYSFRPHGKAEGEDLIEGEAQRIKDPYLAEAKVISSAMLKEISDEKAFVKTLSESKISGRVFYETLRSRLHENAENGIHSHQDIKQDIAFVEQLAGRTNDQYKVDSFPFSPEEENRQKEQANAVIDGWVKEGMKAYTVVDKPSRDAYEEEKKDFLSRAKQAGWNESYAHDSETMEDIFDARYDMNGNVIPAVDEAINAFALGEGDVHAARGKYLDNVKKVISDIPQESRSAGAVRALRTLNNSSVQWEKDFKEREDFVKNAEKCGFDLSKDELRSVYECLKYVPGSFTIFEKELPKGVSGTYPQVPFNKESRIGKLQQNDMLIRLRDLLNKDIRNKDPKREEVLKILEKGIDNTRDEAKIELEQVLPQVIEEKRAAFEAKAATLKEQGLKLTENDFKAIPKLVAGFKLGNKAKKAVAVAFEKLTKLGDSMKAAQKDWGSEAALPFKEALVNLDKAIGVWLDTVTDKREIKPAMLDMITKISPERADVWRAGIAQNEMVNANQVMERETQRQMQERQNAQALAQRQQQKESLMTLLRNMERTGNSYAGHTNTDKYNDMINALKTLREHGRPEEAEQYDNLVQNVKERMKDYLDKKDGLESAWHKNGNVRRECALLGISLIEPALGAEYIGRANSIRWRRNHISLETLKHKRGVGLLARSLEQAQPVQARGQVNDIGFGNLAEQVNARGAEQNNAQRDQIRAGAAQRRNAAADAKKAPQNKVPQRDSMKKN